MREIKFRAWFTLENKMVDHENLSLQYDRDEGFTFAFDYLSYFDEEDIKGTLNFELMQYTGLHDKNGKEIYESDIIKYLSQKMIVRFGVCPDNGVTCFYLENTVEDITTYVLTVFVGNNCEIIGNIHENIELLEVPGNA